MIEHLSNCHGEWNFILATAGAVPFVGVWLRTKLRRHSRKEHM